MDKDFYTLKEVLFGLRAEQLRIEKELFSLERMLKNYNDKRYEGSHFLTSSINNYQELYYKLMINYSLKEKICSLFINKVNLFNYLGTTLSITKNNKE